MLVQLDHVKKEYEDFALELDMQIPENRVTGLIGANGAGKSTTFKLMLGLIRPDAGDVKVFGKKAGKLYYSPTDSEGRAECRRQTKNWNCFFGQRFFRIPDSAAGGQNYAGILPGL